MSVVQPLLFFLLITTILGWIIGWLARKLKSDKQIFTLSKKLDNLRGTVARQRLELSATEGKNNYIESLVKDQKAPIADQQFDSEYDKLKVSEKDLKIKLSQLYAKKQVEIERLSVHVQNLESRLNTINNESTIEGYPEDIANDIAKKLQAQLEKSEAKNAEYIAKIKQFKSASIATSKANEPTSELNPGSVFEAKLSSSSKKSKVRSSANVKTSAAQKPAKSRRKKDDLTAINGVGPKIQGILNKEGVHTFRQIADLRAADIRNLDEKLGSFGGRIIRDEWVKQAKAMLKKGSGVASATSRKARTSSGHIPKKNSRSSHRQNDDLTLIKGVGPKIQAILNKEGIYQFSQISSFKTADIRALSSKLGSFTDRITRDNWIQQAKKLAK